MIAVDTNLLVYAHRTDSTFHTEADTCLRELWSADRDGGAGLCDLLKVS